MSDYAIQAAVYARLVAALSPTPVYDHVPQDQAPLHVRIGQDSATPDNTKTANGAEHTVEIDIYSSKRGFSETKLTMKKIYEALHRQRLYPSGTQVVIPQFDFSECFEEPDGSRGVIRFRLQT